MPIPSAGANVPLTPEANGSERGFRPDDLIAAVALGALFLAPMIISVAPLIFLTFGLYLAVRRPTSTIDALARNWYILVLPLFALSSVLWSVEPSISMRYGTQLVLTFVVAIVIAHRITPHAFLTISFVASIIIILASVIHGGARMDGIALGVFAAKNAYATAISMFALAALGVALAPESGRILRLAGLFGVIATPALLLSARSSGATVTMIISAATLLMFAVGGWMAPNVRRSYFAMIFALCTVAALLIFIFHEQILSLLLDVFEKDATITGRTDLWDVGTRLIGQRPFFGLGYQAFWVQETALAEELWAYFNIPNRSGFHFHNTYISIGVELGITGAVLTGLLLFASLARSVQWAVKEPFGTECYFVAFAVLVATRSMVEVDVFYQFSTTSITIVCGLIYANQAIAAARLRQPHAVPRDKVRTILYPARLQEGLAATADKGP